MKFSILGFTAASCIVSVSADTCQSYCDGLMDCRNDPQAHGSYCMNWNNPSVCFGLFWTDASETQMCFQPNSSVPCPQDRPVRCTSCEAICNSTPSCINDPHAHGSYCKSYQPLSVCFGLYYTDPTRTVTCFQPNDPTCPEEIPVECPAEVGTDAAPGEPTAAPADPNTVAPATVPAPPTTPRPVTVRAAGMSGTFRGSLHRVIDDLTVVFTSSSIMDISLTGFGQTFAGTNISYRLDGNNVVLVHDAALTAFLATFPVTIAPESITIVYDPSDDSLTGTLMGMAIRGTRV